MNIVAKQPTLRPSDVVVACQLVLTPAGRFGNLAKATGISVGECHNAVRRLRLARLLLPDERRVSTEILKRFLADGVPFAFPPVLGLRTTGVPTAHSSPAFHAAIATGETFVWPHEDGAARGQSLTPLFPGAVALVDRNPRLYELLTIVDALRVGPARVRKIAAELLNDHIGSPST